jgi:hypothetical protein
MMHSMRGRNEKHRVFLYDPITTFFSPTWLIVVCIHNLFRRYISFAINEQSLNE